MNSASVTRAKDIEVGRIRLENGWKGMVLICGAAARKFSQSDLTQCFAHPQTLLDDIDLILKKQQQIAVVVKTIVIGNTRTKAVIKHHQPQFSIRQFFRSLAADRATRNFKTARKLLSAGIPAAIPLAALHQRILFLTRQSIYISEYIENSIDLAAFVSNHLAKESHEVFHTKKQLCHQLASILAMLHKNGLWHRDAKASNFIVRKNTPSNFDVLLTDMDGIKSYGLRRTSQQTCALWRLAASFLDVPGVNRTDCLRVFTSYCDLTGIAPADRHRLFSILAEKARAKYLHLASRSGDDKGITAAYKNILIIKPSALGDIVLALPALAALRKSFPDARISWLVRPEFAPLLQNHPHLTDIIFFDRKLLAKAWFNPRAFNALLSLIRRLRNSRFDAVFDLQGLFRTAFLSWLTGCKKRFGMAKAREMGHLFYTHKVAQDSTCVHMVDYYLRIIRAAGASGADVQFVLPIDPNAVERTREILADNGVKQNNYIVLVPGASRANKRWPTERFAALAEKISSRFGASVVATGSASEWEYVRRLQELADVPIVNLAGRTSLPELAALLAKAGLVVTNDTGPGHIAAALDRPLVMIFGHVNPARLSPYHRENCVAAVQPHNRGLVIRDKNPRYDVRNITLDEVYQLSCEQLAQG